jgi:division protein CdvB (Snf7/Vps24/ESCRT-III family)
MNYPTSHPWREANHEKIKQTNYCLDKDKLSKLTFLFLFLTAIRQKNQSVNFLRMSARVDAVASRVQSVSSGNLSNSQLFKGDIWLIKTWN